MTSLIVAAVAFVLLHLLVSGTRVRDLLSARLGSGPYMGLFSLASVAILVWLGFAYGAARHLSDNPVFWDLTSATRHLQIGVQLIAMLLIVPGLLTANPTSVRRT